MIRADQIAPMILPLLTAAYNEKEVFITSPAGTGKTTMAKVFGLLCGKKALPAVVHISPFPVAERDRIDLADYISDHQALLKMLEQSKVPPHFKATTEVMRAFLKSLNESRDRALIAKLQTMQFISDEHDSETYRWKEHGSTQGIARLLSSFGCQRRVNMSFTDNEAELQVKRKQLSEKIKHFTRLYKTPETWKPFNDSKSKKASLDLKLLDVDARLRALQENKQALLNATMTFESLSNQSSLSILQNTTRSVEKGRSYLLEMPDTKISQQSSTQSLTVEEIKCVAVNDVAIMYRDHPSGELMVAAGGKIHFLAKLGEGDLVALKSNYRVLCLYTSDCAGGDFGDFVYGDRVAGQTIVYQNEMRGNRANSQYVMRHRQDETRPVSRDVRWILPIDTSRLRRDEFLAESELLKKKIDKEISIERLEAKVARKQNEILAPWCTKAVAELKGRFFIGDDASGQILRQVLLDLRKDPLNLV
jgi:hypothetical protein